MALRAIILKMFGPLERRKDIIKFLFRKHVLMKKNQSYDFRDSLAPGLITAAMKLKDPCSLEEKL